jgi:putative ABC transport system substrate-binding protein
MTRRRDLLSLVVLNAVGSSQAQPKAPLRGRRRLAVLRITRREDAADLERELRSALAEFGWVVDRNLTIEWHFADDDRSRLPALAAQVVRSAPDAILTFLTPPTRALQQATTTIPIVTGLGDPFEFGFARSLARPGGNITGLSFGWVESQRKRVELVRSAAPAAKWLILAMNARDAEIVQLATRSTVTAAREFGFVPEIALVATADALRASLRSDGVSAMITFGFDRASSPIKASEVIAMSLDKKVPTVVDVSEFVAIGGLLSYELYWDKQMQRFAAQLDKVLRGVSPAEIPFELPTRSWMAVNLKTARAIGLVLPRSLVARADEVIE